MAGETVASRNAYPSTKSSTLPKHHQISNASIQLPLNSNCTLPGNPLEESQELLLERKTKQHTNDRNLFYRYLVPLRPDAIREHAFMLPLPITINHAEEGAQSTQRIFEIPGESLHLVALEGGKTVQAIQERDWPAFIYIIHGEITVKQGDSTLRCSSGDCILLSNSPVLWQSGAYSIVCLAIAPREAVATMQSIAQKRSHSNALFQVRTSCIKASDGDREASLLAVLHHLLAITDELIANQHLQASMCTTNQLMTLAVLMAHPEIKQNQQPISTEASSINKAINQLTHYITENLSQPLDLTILEQYSHYSRRSLQYAFRQHFGCTITQWIRSKRLDMAFQQLKHATRVDSVSSIAHACGYRSAGLFSIEFQNRFHIKPSILLREHQQWDSGHKRHAAGENGV